MRVKYRKAGEEAMLEQPDAVGNIPKRLLTINETAAYLGLSPRTIYNAIAPKSRKPFQVKPKRIGKLVRFDIRDLDQYVDSLNS